MTTNKPATPQRVPDITVPHRLRIARETSGLDQTELADLIGVSRGTISNAENGRRNPRQIVVNAWATATGVPVEWLMNGVAA
jgi:transcriptional regulator with XRE-family HTH domain